MRGGPDKVIVYIDGILCAMDREAKITIPVSRGSRTCLNLTTVARFGAGFDFANCGYTENPERFRLVGH